MGNPIPSQTRSVDPYASYNSNIVSALTRTISNGINCIVKSDPVTTTTNGTTVTISTGSLIKDDILIEITNSIVIDFSDSDFYVSAGSGWDENGYYYVVLDYTYSKSKPAPIASVKIIKPSQIASAFNTDNYILLQVVNCNGTSNLIIELFDYDPSIPSNRLLYSNAEANDIASPTVDYDVLPTDRIIELPVGATTNITVTLPPAIFSSKHTILNNSPTYTLNVAARSSDTIEGNSQISLVAQWGSLDIISNRVDSWITTSAYTIYDLIDTDTTSAMNYDVLQYKSGQWVPSGPTLFRIDAAVSAFNGNVGIGTTSPAFRLDSFITSAVTDAVVDVASFNVGSDGTVADGLGVGIQFAVENSNGDQSTVAKIQGIAEDVTAGTVDGALVFLTREDNATTAERMRIISTGNVGIGTNNPSTLLDVRIDQNAPTQVKIQNNGTGILALAQILFKSNSATGSITVFDDGYISAGSAQADSFRISSEAETSNFIIAAEGASTPITFYQNALEVMRIDSNGNVGIGTTSPTSLLDVQGVIRATDLQRDDTNGVLALTGGNSSIVGANILLYGSTHATLADVTRFRYGSTETMRIDSNGNVGIGTTSPDALLDVRGKSYLGDSANEQQIFLRNAHGTSLVGIGTVSDNSVSAALTLFSGSTTSQERMRIDPNGNIGIGTTSPDRLLHIESITASPAYFRLGMTDTTIIQDQEIGTIEFETFDAASPGVGAVISAIGDGTAGEVALTFRTGVGGSSADRMRIDSSGNVGIGTITPVSELVIYSASSPFLQFQDGDTGQTTTDGFRIGLDSPSNDAYIQNYENADIVFATGLYGSGHQEWMRILSGGNVGIGTGSPTVSLDIESTNVSATAIDIRNTGIHADLEATWRIQVPGSSSTGRQGFFEISAVEKGGSGVSGTPSRLVIDHAGSVGIGTTSPTELLHLKQTIGDTTITLETNTQTSNAFTLRDSNGRLEIGDIAMTILKTSGNVGIGLTPTANMSGLSIEAGLITLKETTLPTPDNGYGKIWCQTDNNLYFQDGDAKTHTIMNPSGSITIFAGKIVPTGWLECDGQSMLQSDYPKLYTALDNGSGTCIYGEADGTHFYVPDLRGQFIRGYDNTAGIDPDAATRTDSGDGVTTGDNVGTKQAEEFKLHNHNLNHTVGSNYQYTGGGTTSIHSGSADSGPAGGNETRPINVNMMYIIKI